MPYRLSTVPYGPGVFKTRVFVSYVTGQGRRKASLFSPPRHPVRHSIPYTRAPICSSPSMRHVSWSYRTHDHWQKFGAVSHDHHSSPHTSSQKECGHFRMRSVAPACSGSDLMWLLASRSNAIVSSDGGFGLNRSSNRPIIRSQSRFRSLRQTQKARGCRTSQARLPRPSTVRTPARRTQIS